MTRLLPIACVGALLSCGSEPGPAGTTEMRAALFDSIVAKTERREAWSPVKNAALGFDPMAAMRAERDAFIAADTEEELYYAILRLSAARRDRHLSVDLVPGGLQLSDSSGLDIVGQDDVDAPRAPVRIFPDLGQDGPVYFIGDVAEEAAGPEGPQVGERVVAVNGLPIAEWEAEATRTMRHSTVAGLRWKLADIMAYRSAILSPELRADELALTLEGEQGTRTVRLEWSDEDSWSWPGVGEPHYPGFEERLSTVTFDLLVDASREIAILTWTGFRETMIDDVDALMAYAVETDLLDHTLIIDVTRSGGGSRGAYALQRLQGEPFTTTFGNLRLSDVIEPFVEERRAAFGNRAFLDGETPETLDDGSWLMEWLEEDVMPALERGDEYSTTVPFKSAHAPKDSDGVLQPAEVHFRGPFAVMSGPDGGSHLDQFVHQVVDNNLGPVVGMPPGGYSNTWEWEEVLTFPGRDEPIAHFMWNIGHTVTPDGEIAEGNPAVLDAFIPLTAENVEEYHTLLLDAALSQLAARDR
ncbi:MAG: hypothetical protein AAF389_09430 [Gemmatimonadota bacterium]